MSTKTCVTGNNFILHKALVKQDVKFPGSALVQDQVRPEHVSENRASDRCRNMHLAEAASPGSIAYHLDN